MYVCIIDFGLVGNICINDVLKNWCYDDIYLKI